MSETPLPMADAVSADRLAAVPASGAPNNAPILGACYGACMRRVYANRTGLVDEMLELAPAALGLDADASTPARIEAWLAYARAAFEEERRVRAYAELADLEAERVAAVRAAAVGAADDGIL